MLSRTNDGRKSYQRHSRKDSIFLGPKASSHAATLDDAPLTDSVSSLPCSMLSECGMRSVRPTGKSLSPAGDMGLHKGNVAKYQQPGYHALSKTNNSIKE